MSDETELTPEQVASWQKRQNEAEQQRIMAAAQEIADYAKSLGVVIVGTAQLAEIAPGVMGVVAGWGVQAIKQ